MGATEISNIPGAPGGTHDGFFYGVLKDGAEGRDPALCFDRKCSLILEYAALSKTPHALADGLMHVFQHPHR
jgi:hypothetical protein